MSYCADIKVPKERGLVCVMTGCHEATPEASLAVACYEAHTWYVREAGYSCAVVQVWELCDACKGHGKTPIPRRIYAYRECKACKGRGQWEFGFPEHVG